MSSLLPVPRGVQHTCHYDVVNGCVVHMLSYGSFASRIVQSKTMAPGEFEKVWHETLSLLFETARPIRSILAPRFSILSHKYGEFYLRDHRQGIDHALPPCDEAFYINQQCHTSITQGEFDGEYRRTHSQVRSAAPPAASPGAGGTPPLSFAQFARTHGAFSACAEPARKAARVEHCAPKCGEIVGHRAWFWDGQRNSLTSVGHWPLQWVPQEPMRDITLGDDEGPLLEDVSKKVQVDNKRGIWSFKNPNGPIHEYLLASGSGKYAAGTAVDNKLMLVLGTCWQWGTVIEHDNGYRSQFGAVRSLDAAYWIEATGIMPRHLDPLGIISQMEGIWHPFKNDEFLQPIRQQYGVADAS